MIVSHSSLSNKTIGEGSSSTLRVKLKKPSINGSVNHNDEEECIK
jgi:hypothetical protein